MSRWAGHLKGPPKRCGHAAVTVGDRVLFFPGSLEEGRMEPHVLEFQESKKSKKKHELKWKPLLCVERDHAPSNRTHHTAVLIDRTVYLWGGYTHEDDNTLYAFDVDNLTWSKPETSGKLPEAMTGHSACVSKHVIYIYGTHNTFMDEYRNLSCKMYKLDTNTWVWSVADKEPDKEPQHHSATVIGTKMFVFGGSPDPEANRTFVMYNDFRVFDTENDCWLPPKEEQHSSSPQLLPDGRGEHSAFAYNGELYIFGGRSLRPLKSFDDLWKFNPETFSWKKLAPEGEGPPGRYGMCCCMLGDLILLCGGEECVEKSKVDELYILELSSPKSQGAV